MVKRSRLRKKPAGKGNYCRECGRYTGRIDYLIDKSLVPYCSNPKCKRFKKRD